MQTKPPLYVDACSLIDSIKFDVGLLPTDRNSDAWHLKQLMRAHADKSVTIYTSFLSVAECVSIEPGQATVPPDIQERFRNLLLSGQYLRLATPTPRTAMTCQDLRWKHNLVLRGADMLHIATALELGCLEFITTDERLKKTKTQDAANVLASKRLRIITAKDTALLPSIYGQSSILGTADARAK